MFNCVFFILMYNYFGLWAIGGIGRHMRLKIWFSSESASSSLASPTIENKVLFEYKSVNVCVSEFKTPTHIDLQRNGMDSKFIVFY